MAERSSRNSLKRALDKATKPNVYVDIIAQVTPTIIPVRFIEYVTVFYKNGESFNLTGSDITEPVPVKRAMSARERTDTRSKMSDIKVFINTIALGDEIDESVNALFRKHDIID